MKRNPADGEDNGGRNHGEREAKREIRREANGWVKALNIAATDRATLTNCHGPANVPFPFWTMGDAQCHRKKNRSLTALALALLLVFAAKKRRSRATRPGTAAAGILEGPRGRVERSFTRVRWNTTRRKRSYTIPGRARIVARQRRFQLHGRKRKYGTLT